MADKSARANEVTTFRYVGNHAAIMENGAPLAPGDFIDLEKLDGIDKMLFDDGNLIEASSSTKTNTEEEKTA
jgi:hypothetical protein